MAREDDHDAATILKGTAARMARLLSQRLTVMEGETAAAATLEKDAKILTALARAAITIQAAQGCEDEAAEDRASPSRTEPFSGEGDMTEMDEPDFREGPAEDLASLRASLDRRFATVAEWCGPAPAPQNDNGGGPSPAGAVLAGAGDPQPAPA